MVFYDIGVATALFTVFEAAADFLNDIATCAFVSTFYDIGLSDIY